MTDFELVKLTLGMLVDHLRKTVREERGMTTETAIITALLSAAALAAVTLAIRPAIDRWLGQIK
ncbi:MAG: hypothetical protein ACRD29_10630 [Acidimicrobiales bacterium]